MESPPDAANGILYNLPRGAASSGLISPTSPSLESSFSTSTVSKRRHGKTDSLARQLKKKTKLAPVPHGSRPRIRMGRMSDKQAAESFERLVKPRKLTEAKARQSDDASANSEPGPSEGLDSLGNANMDALITNNEKKMTENALQRCGKKVAPHTPPGGPYSIIGIQTPLSPIQFGTLGWMLEREASKTLGQGGIVAHGMGIGKTLIALALMAVKGTGARARKDVNAPTLVIVPSHIVINHWIEEAKKHASETFPPRSIVRYNDLRRVDLEKIPSSVGVVFSTYCELYRYRSVIKKSTPSACPQGSAKDEEEDGCGPGLSTELIFRAHWFRIILDEAHTIKNNKSQTFKTIKELKKRHSWSITATPLSNSRNEMFPYFRFLELEGTKDLGEFQETYFPRGVPNLKMKKTLATVMLHRYTISDSFGGEKILEMPELDISDIECPPTATEKVLLNFLDSRIKESAKNILEQSIKEKEQAKVAISKATSSVASLLHLYRYAAVHSFMLENALIRLFKPEDLEKMADDMAAIAENDQDANGPLSLPVIFRLARQDQQLLGLVCLSCKTKCGTLSECIFKAGCGHIICEKCLCLEFTKDIKCKIESCGKVWPRLEMTRYPTLRSPAPRDDESDEESANSEGANEPVSPGTDMCGYKPPLEANKSRFLRYSDQYMMKLGMVVPSARLSKIEFLLKKWQREAPNDKIIAAAIYLVFTQFMVVASLIGRVADLQGIKYLYYIGDMSVTARQKSLKMFREDPTAKVLIASLLCGGQSLNITAANRVILTELWWNTPAEEQAFARVHRFGQTKEIHLVRLRCPGTRDDDILQMQASKDAELSSCLMSKQYSKSRHSLHKVLSLVGRPIVDAEGTIIGIQSPKEGAAPCDIDDDLYSLASDGGDLASDSGDDALGFD